MFVLQKKLSRLNIGVLFLFCGVGMTTCTLREICHTKSKSCRRCIETSDVELLLSGLAHNFSIFRRYYDTRGRNTIYRAASAPSYRIMITVLSTELIARVHCSSYRALVVVFRATLPTLSHLMRLSHETFCANIAQKNLHP